MKGRQLLLLSDSTIFSHENGVLIYRFHFSA